MIFCARDLEGREASPRERAEARERGARNGPTPRVAAKDVDREQLARAEGKERRATEAEQERIGT